MNDHVALLKSWCRRLGKFSSAPKGSSKSNFFSEANSVNKLNSVKWNSALIWGNLSTIEYQECISSTSYFFWKPSNKFLKLFSQEKIIVYEQPEKAHQIQNKECLECFERIVAFRKKRSPVSRSGFYILHRRNLNNIKFRVLLTLM